MSDELKNLAGESTEAGTGVSQNVSISKENPARSIIKSGIPWLPALTIVLAVAVVILYILHFSEKGRSNEIGMSNVLNKANSGKMAVAFVNNDSILSNYELVKKMRKELEAKESKLSNEIATKQATFDKDAAYFQEQVQKKSISEQSAQEIYANLSQDQQKINGLRDQYAAELQQNEMNMNVAVLDSIMNFLRRYNQKYKFDYILGFNKGGNILFANDTLDITPDVLKELNLEYAKKQK